MSRLLCKKIIAVIVLVFMFVGFVESNSYALIDRLFSCLDMRSGNTVDMLEKEFASAIWKKPSFLNFNGRMARILGIQSYFSNEGIYVTDDKYIVGMYPYTTTDYEFDEIMDFYVFLKDSGINLLYVNEPIKYTDDMMMVQKYGVETYSNRNMDVFVNRIRNAGINAIDLREDIEKEGIEASDLFYRTDHHWTTNAGVWATKKIAEGLNDTCGYSIDVSIYDKENFDEKKWENCWLGEQGKIVASTYVGLDDFVEIKPNYSTKYLFKGKDDDVYGTFDNFINEDIYNLENDKYENQSWHYSYKKKDSINCNVDEGRVLVLGDSYDYVTIPFLSLGIHQVDTLTLRDCDDSFDLREYILDNEYDTVIIAYAQFMLGAHDDVSNANYRMFSFR